MWDHVCIFDNCPKDCTPFGVAVPNFNSPNVSADQNEMQLVAVC